MLQGPLKDHNNIAYTQKLSSAQELRLPQPVQAYQIDPPYQVAKSPQSPIQQQDLPPSRASQQIMQDTQLQPPLPQQQADHQQYTLSSTYSPGEQQPSPPPLYPQSSSSQAAYPFETQNALSGVSNTFPQSTQHQAVNQPPLSSTPPILGYTRPQSVSSYNPASLESRRALSRSDSDGSRWSLSSNIYHNNEPSNQEQHMRQQSNIQFSNDLWAQEFHANSSCKVCTHCRSGIPYFEPYFRCLFCQLNICNKCHRSHPAAHHQSLVKTVSKQSVPGAARSEKGCSRCQKYVHCRHDCHECSFTLCDECQSASNDCHKHRSFISFEPPFRSLKVSGAASSQHPCTHTTVSNCSRCEGPIDLRHYGYRCRTCLLCYDGSVNLCEACYSESWTSHDPSHEAISIKFEPVSNDLESGLRCYECDGKFPSLDRMTLVRHAHKSYVFNVGPRVRESIVNEAFRMCQLKPFRTDQPQVLGCSRCKHDFPALTMRICAGSCEGTFCEHCFPLASVNHMHGPNNFRSLVDKPRLDIGFLPAGWRAMENKEGRVYYIQDLTNAFTFNKPAVPDALPDGWVKTVDPLGKTMYLHHQTNTSSYVSPVYGVAPAGWELKQTEAGRLFYVNRQTQVTSWHKPHSEPLPSGWEAGQHSDGRVYYINHVTKTNTWIKPTLPANASVISSNQVITPANPAVAMRPTVTMMRPSGGPLKPASMMANPSGFVTGPVVSGVRPQVAPMNSTTLPLRPMSTMSNPTPQHMRPVQVQPRPVTVAARASVPQQVTNSPVASTQANATSSVGSFANSVAQNPQAVNAALNLGIFAIKAAVASDSGDYSQVQHTGAASHGMSSSTLTNMSSNSYHHSHPGTPMTQPYGEIKRPAFYNTGNGNTNQYLVQNEQTVTSSSSSQSQMPLVDSYSYSNSSTTPTGSSDLVENTVATSFTSNQSWIPDPAGSALNDGNQNPVSYSTYPSQNLVVEDLGTSSTTTGITVDYQGTDTGQVQVYDGGYDITSNSSANFSSTQDYNTYQPQTQESVISFSVDTTSSQDFSSYDTLNTGVVDDSFVTANDTSFTVDTSFECDFSTQDSACLDLI